MSTATTPSSRPPLSDRFLGGVERIGNKLP